MKQGVIYARVSSKDQEDGFSIPAQLKLLREYALKQGIKIIREFVDVETAKCVIFEKAKTKEWRRGGDSTPALNPMDLR